MAIPESKQWTITGLSANACSFTMACDVCLAEVKEIILKRMGIPVEEQVLVDGESLIVHESRLASLVNKAGSEIFLTVIRKSCDFYFRFKGRNCEFSISPKGVLHHAQGGKLRSLCLSSQTLDMIKTLSQWVLHLDTSGLDGLSESTESPLQFEIVCDDISRAIYVDHHAKELLGLANFWTDCMRTVVSLHFGRHSYDPITGAAKIGTKRSLETETISGRGIAGNASKAYKGTTGNFEALPQSVAGPVKSNAGYVLVAWLKELDGKELKDILSAPGGLHDMSELIENMHEQGQDYAMSCAVDLAESSLRSEEITLPDSYTVAVFAAYTSHEEAKGAIQELRDFPGIRADWAFQLV